MCTKFLSFCAAILWIVCTLFAVGLGMIIPIKLLIAGANNTVGLLSILLLCYTYIAYVMYTINYARARWNPTKDSIYVPQDRFDKVQASSIVAMATIFIICLIVTIFR